MADFEIKEFSELMEKRLKLLTLRRLGSIRLAVEKEVKKVSKGLFRWMSDNVLNQKGNRFPPKYTEVPEWPPLSRSYVKEKEHSKFWYNKAILSAYLFNTSPHRILGTPKISARNEMNQYGEVFSYITVIPYPRKDNMHLQRRIYNRLFAKTKRRLGNKVVFMSNDEVRPIFEPSLRWFAKNKINRAIKETIKRELRK